MRKILIVLLIVIVTMSILWVFDGRQLSLFIDRFETVEALSRPIKTLAYEGNGTGGILHVEDIALSLNEAQLGGAQPNVGTTKEGQLALSFGGKVFPFGPIQSGTENLVTAPPASDDATVSVQHSAISWPNFFNFNFMSGKSPSWKRHLYQKLVWKKTTGAELEMVWRYEQYFYGDQGWLDGAMTREGTTGLIRIEISNAAR